MNERERRKKRYIDWTSHKWWNTGIVRVGRIAFPGYFVIVPWVLALLGSIAFTTFTGGEMNPFEGIWWPAAVVVAVPVLIFAVVGVIAIGKLARYLRREVELATQEVQK